MENLSLHLLDIAENSVRAGAREIEIGIVEDAQEELLTIRIRDNGKGMDEEARKTALDPFYTTKGGKRVGMGLALLAQASEEAGGEVTIESEPRRGTAITATFRTDHPDMRPMGDIAETIGVLAVGHPEIRLIFEYDSEDGKQRFDSHAELP